MLAEWFEVCTVSIGSIMSTPAIQSRDLSLRVVEHDLATESSVMGVRNEQLPGIAMLVLR